MKIRASSLPLISQCAPAALPPGARIEIGEPSVPAMGSATHVVIANRLLGEKHDLGEIAERFQVDLSELEKSAEIAMGAVSHVAKFFQRPESEKALEWKELKRPEGFHISDELLLTGHVDLCEFDPITKEARGLDFKTGWLDYDASQQCKAYAFLLMKHYGAEQVWFGQLNVRSRSLVASLWSAEHLESWWAWLKRHLAEQVYRPSYSACSLCKRWHECPAGQELATTASGALVQANTGEFLERLTPEAAITAIEACRFLEKQAASVRDLVKVYVAKHGGRVECEDGSYLELNKANWRKVQFTPEAATVLRDKIGDRIHDLHLSVGEIEAAAKAMAPNKSKGWYAQQTFKALEDCGALKVEVSDRLDVRPAPRKIGVA